MVFSSYIFLFYFLPLTLLIYYMIPARTRNLSLIVLGYIFYGWANPKFIFLMFGTTLVDWLVSIVIAHNSWKFWKTWHLDVVPLERGAERTGTQRGAIVASVVSNLLMLGFFKYFNFGVESYNSLMASLGMTGSQWHTALKVVLPLGISFYTFQSLSYTIDVYRGDAKAMKNFKNFACFVSMFPHLVAGPILQFSFLAEQLENRKLTLEKFARGVAIFSLGLGKKILLANPCGKIADSVFNAGPAGVVDSWFGAVAYAFQIYFDFSGYSDMAIGLGLMLGFVFAKNFDSPYKSQSITEFWRRWHISLSTWLRDYLYIPLGGNRKGEAMTYINLALTMLLGGLWHGASWNFVIWGGIHGGWLAFERSQGRTSFYHNMPKILRIAVTFLIVLLSWVFFRAGTLSGALDYLACMVGLGNPQAGAALLGGLIYQPYYLLWSAVAAVGVWFCPQSWDITRNMTWPKAVACMLVLWLAMVVLFTQSYNPFIYFIF